MNVRPKRNAPLSSDFFNKVQSRYSMWQVLRKQWHKVNRWHKERSGQGGRNSGEDVEE